MTVEIDRNSGFCFGVINAITRAEKELAKGEELFCLGEIVHNDAEVNRLAEQGLKTIMRDKLKDISRKTILIRAHGEPPSTFRMLEDSKNKILDATCPVVLKLQKKVKECYQKNIDCGGQVVIFGKKGHPEVNGLVGQTDDTAVVVGSREELSQIDFTRPVSLFSQTTMDGEAFDIISNAIRTGMREAMKKDDVPLTIHNTICGAVSNRVPMLKKFSEEHDIIIFVSGKESSNGRVLHQICHSVNKRTYHVSQAGDIQTEWFQKNDRVGICGATSTPRWQMEQIADLISNLNL